MQVWVAAVVVLAFLLLAASKAAPALLKRPLRLPALRALAAGDDATDGERRSVHDEEGASLAQYVSLQ